jgi:hypothetical protein
MNLKNDQHSTDTQIKIATPRIIAVAISLRISFMITSTPFGTSASGRKQPRNRIIRR